MNGGGLAFGQDLVRYAYNAAGFDAGRCFELCSGPGFIGFALMAAGVCESLALADINPRAIAAVKATLALPANAWLSNATSIYLSNGLDAIPSSSEKWDLVVSNPPHFSERGVGGPRGGASSFLCRGSDEARRRGFDDARLAGRGRLALRDDGTRGVQHHRGRRGLEAPSELL